MGAGAGFILASASPRRAKLLTAAGFDFAIAADAVDEVPAGAIPARELCRENARRKAMAASFFRREHVVLSADTVVVLHGETFGKPTDLTHARQMLASLCGQTHEVLTGVCIVHASVNRRMEFVESTRVRFRHLHDVCIDSYLARVNPLDKAGAYAAQEDEGALIEEMEGSHSNVVGLPIERVREALAAFGIRPR